MRKPDKHGIHHVRRNALLHLGFAAQPFFNASVPGLRGFGSKLKGLLVKAEQGGHGRMAMSCNFALLVTMLSV